MRLVRIGARFINLEGLIYARILLDPDGSREIILRFRASTGTDKNMGLASLRLEGDEAKAMEALLNSLCEYSKPAEPPVLGPMHTQTDWHRNF